MRGHTESETILLMINGRLTSVKGVKKRATCNDVINMARAGVTMEGKSRDLLALFESSSGEERLLLPGTNIRKVIRSWGNDTSYSLVLKPTDCMKAKMATVSRTKRNLQKLMSVMSSNKTTVNANDIANNIDNCVKTTKRKSLTEFEAKPDNLCEKKGKLALFHRYISDVLSHRSKSAAATSHNSAFVHAEAECTDIVVRDVDDNSDYEYLDHEHTDMNMAFIGETFADMNTAFIDETLTDSYESHCDILNQQVYTDPSITSDESGFGDDSVCSIDALEKNVFDCELDVTVVHAGWLQEGLTPTDNTVIKHEHIHVKNIFSEGVSSGDMHSLDDSMDSFMNTRVSILEHDDSDDGLSSLGSDMGSV